MRDRLTELVREPIRLANGGGAMLYKPSGAGKPGIETFDASAWIARGAVVGEALGRGTTWILQDGDRRLVLRHYRRGGLIARLSPDRYLWRGEDATRPFRELRLLDTLYAAGLPVPVPVAACYRRDGLFYRGDILTVFLPDTESLAQRIRRGTADEASWQAVGRCLRRFHDFGVFHADLNAHNLLLAGAAEVFVIDFDRGELRQPGLWRDANLVRLRRSIEKIGDACGKAFDEDAWRLLLRAYA
jgi:3-deoxy-D-manno-octulosonic acid kinase